MFGGSREGIFRWRNIVLRSRASAWSCLRLHDDADTVVGEDVSGVCYIFDASRTSRCRTGSIY